MYAAYTTSAAKPAHNMLMPKAYQSSKQGVMVFVAGNEVVALVPGELLHAREYHSSCCATSVVGWVARAVERR